MNLAEESHIFDHQQYSQSRFANLERERLIDEALAPHRSHILARISDFIQILNHVRRIRIEVTFDYQETSPETVGVR